MLKEMTVDQLINELSLLPKELTVVVINDGDSGINFGLDVGMNIQHDKAIIHVGKIEKEVETARVNM